MKSIVSLSILAIFCLGFARTNPMQRMWHGIKSDVVPYHVHLWVYDLYDESWPGSGVLISQKHVLTAAVNIHHYNRWDMGFGSQSQKGLTLITSYNAFVHEQFDDETDDNNIGIIVMDHPLHFSDIIYPVSLPSQSEQIPRPGQIGIISAYSYMSDFGPISTNLEYGTQTVLKADECEKVYPHLHGIVNHFFCATDADFNVCGGAQGAGLVIKEKGRIDVLAGIVSFGNIWKGCSAKIPPGFIKISEYVNWINSKTISDVTALAM